MGRLNGASVSLVPNARERLPFFFSDPLLWTNITRKKQEKSAFCCSRDALLRNPNVEISSVCSVSTKNPSECFSKTSIAGDQGAK
ncbi:hypothetical protein KFK09_001259 [Dendrobium nobile]|uniref:Uncharacterized protein n=1 Tax=Dendrobium nobile TaxID=94219 RepID=A0A8T3C6T0_DENNO|nr:hypothetical protein KFK09_001259 [Dendrobium nobile]